MHQLNETGSVTLANGEDYWFTTYLEYAFETGILDDEYGYEYYYSIGDEYATRGMFMSIFSRALPSTKLRAVNEVEDGAIPDVSSGYIFKDAVYQLYRAGILRGVDDRGSPNVDAEIIRAEVAVIITRMVDESARLSFTMNKSTSTGGSQGAGSNNNDRQPSDKWSPDAEAFSNRFNGGGFVSTPGYYYMNGADSSAQVDMNGDRLQCLYRVSDNGSVDEVTWTENGSDAGTFPFGAYNMTYYNPGGLDGGYVYFNAYRWDSDPGALYRVKIGSLNAEKLTDSGIAFEFVIVDEYIYYRNDPYSPILENEEATERRMRLYRAPVDKPEMGEIFYQSEDKDNLMTLSTDGSVVYVSVEGFYDGHYLLSLDPDTGKETIMVIGQGDILNYLVMGNRVYMKRYGYGDFDPFEYYSYYDVNSDQCVILPAGDFMGICANDLFVYFVMPHSVGKDDSGYTIFKYTLYESDAGKLGDKLDYRAICSLDPYIPDGDIIYLVQTFHDGGQLYLKLYTQSRDEENKWHLASAVQIGCNILDGSLFDPLK